MQLLQGRASADNNTPYYLKIKDLFMANLKSFPLASPASRFKLVPGPGKYQAPDKRRTR
jgi:hypothetical protein